MLRSILTIFSCFIISSLVSAQQLYMPRDVKEAFKNDTRSTDGMPGKNYWQNHARYDITVTAMPPDSIVKGEETIMYFNESSDSLKNVVIKLFLNIHKPGAPRERGAEPDYLTSGMHIDAVTINGESIPYENKPNTFTWQSLALPTPLAPKDSMAFTFKWHYEISKQSDREGMIDPTTYFLAYFYPRIAVYDDINGWDRMDFVDSHEFYSDFNDYVVTVNVPKNYVVWGTGTLQQPEKLLQPEILKRYYQSFTADEPIHIATKEELDANEVTTQNEMNSWQFKANNIPDMTFGISDHYLWDASSVVVDTVTGRRASAQAAYLESAKDYTKMVGFVQHSLEWLSNNWPGIPYPYEKMTVFQGFAGMEYPMMANDESYENPIFSMFVAEHEIAHTYMPFYMGINETRYGFMDEGWATTFELLIGRDDVGVEAADKMYRGFRIARWTGEKSSYGEIPIITPGDAISGRGLGNNEYGKASLGYLAMKDMLGDELFKKCLHAYMDRWNGKHPIPWDFFNTFNNVSGKDLNWFWENWFFSPHYIDLSLKELVKTKKGYTITIDNIGGMPAPVNVVVSYSDGTTESFHQTPIIWQDNQKQAKVTITTKKKVEEVTLEGNIWMDADVSNNSWKKG